MLNEYSRPSLDTSPIICGIQTDTKNIRCVRTSLIAIPQSMRPSKGDLHFLISFRIFSSATSLSAKPKSLLHQLRNLTWSVLKKLQDLSDGLGEPERPSERARGISLEMPFSLSNNRHYENNAAL